MTRSHRLAVTSDKAAFVAGLTIVAGLAVTDAVLGSKHGVTATVVLGPFLAGLRCTVRQTISVSVAAVLAAFAMGIWNANAFDADQLIREAVVVFGSVLAVLGAGARARVFTLSADLDLAERQLGVAFDSLAAAVMIQRPGRGIVYANQATATAMGMGSPEEVLNATPEQIAQGWETYDEDGAPLLSDRYPSRRILRGDTLAPEPLVVRTINRKTGREYWRVVKASPVLSAAGDLLMTVSITEDITDIKRAEESQRHIAATLQSSLLPEDPPSVPGFRVATMYRPAGHDSWVGGDFFDAFVVDDGWIAVVGDVTGSGAEAAAMTAQARHTLRAIGEQTGDHVAAVTRLNRLLLASRELSLCTVCIVKFKDDDGSRVSASIVCAGHPLPYLVRDREAQEVGTPGALVGAWDASFTATELELRRGDILVLYTDGVVEAKGAASRFGEDRLRATLALAQDAEDVVIRIGDALTAFEAAHQADDTALVVVEYLGH